MNDLEITALPIADSHDIDKLKTLGYDDQANASQVRLSDLKAQPMKASRIDYTTGLFFTKAPFVIGSSELFINGLRYDLDMDYGELVDIETNRSYGIKIQGIDSDDSIVLKAIPAGQYSRQ